MSNKVCILLVNIVLTYKYSRCFKWSYITTKYTPCYERGIQIATQKTQLCGCFPVYCCNDIVINARYFKLNKCRCLRLMCLNVYKKNSSRVKNPIVTLWCLNFSRFLGLEVPRLACSTFLHYYIILVECFFMVYCDCSVER